MIDNQSSQPNSDDVQPQDSDGKKSKSGIIISVLVAAVFLFIVFDPFGIIARLQGAGDPLAKFISADTVFYMSVDLLQVNSEETEEIFSAFQRGAGETYEEGKSLIGQLDSSLEESLNLTFTEDIEPWVGQYIAMSMSNLVLDDWGDLESGDILFIVEAKPTLENEVDEFIKKLVAAMEESGGGPFEEVKHDELTLYEYQSGYPGEDIVIGRYENILFISNDSQNIISAINLESSQSLAGDGSYQAIINEMPGKRMLTFSMDMAVFADILGSMVDLGEEFSIPVRWAVFSISTKSYGLEFNTAAVLDREKMTEAQKETVDASQNFDPKTDEMFPEDTFLYMVGSGLDNTINLLLEGESDEIRDVKESLELFKQEYKIDLLRLFNAFDGEFAIGLVKNSDGLISSSLGGEVGVELEFIIETSQEDVILDEFKTLNLLAGIIDPSLIIEEYSKNNMTLFDIGTDDGFQKMNFLTYGAGGGYAVFSTSPSLVVDSFDGGSSLADNSRYIKALSTFPDGYTPYMFLDVQGILNMLKEGMDEYTYDYISETFGVFEPITLIAAASGSSGNISFGTVIIFIDTSK